MSVQNASNAVRWLLAAAWALGTTIDLPSSFLCATTRADDVAFLVEPYLQLGDVKQGHLAEDLQLLWHSDGAEVDWVVEYQPGTGTSWREAEAPRARGIAVPSITPHWVYEATLHGLTPGDTFAYRVLKGRKIIFAAEGRAPRRADQSYRFVAFGDCGAGRAQQRAVAYQAYLTRPDFVMITGDIVYSRGRISEYREKFWTIYNANEASPLVGAPLLRSTLFLAAPGHHDIATRDLGKYPDGLAYFLYWNQPRNGPPADGQAMRAPALAGPARNTQAFVAAGGGAYPRMANFSFEYGNAHWLILDSNPYVDWTNREMRAWVNRDLAAAASTTWRFVAFHHPGFNSSKAHFNAQQMRRLADLFESGHVDVVFSGHVHNYQRTYPLVFRADPDGDAELARNEDRVPGRWKLDRVFDGRTVTRPQGVIYVITGAGGNTLYNPEQQDDPESWQTFTHRFISKVHSLTIADVAGTTLTVRQVSATGAELDHFIVTK
jgi:hypothetical protein